MTFEITIDMPPPTRAALVQHTISSGQYTKVGMEFQIAIDRLSPEVWKWVDPKNWKLMCSRPELHPEWLQNKDAEDDAIT